MNKFKKILVTGFDRSDLDPRVWARLAELSEAVAFEPVPDLADVDCLLSRFNKVDKVVIDTLPALKYIGLLATGTGTVDLAYAKSQHIIVSNIPGYCTESVAEYVFALILEQLRDLVRAREVARVGDFTGNGFTASEIRGKKFGVIGLGRIGQRVAEIALGFGAEVFYWSKNRKQDIEQIGIQYQDLDILISSSDFLSLHVQTTPETTQLLNAQRLQSIKKNALVINVSGMELVDLPALEVRLQHEDISFIFDHPDEMNKSDVDRLVGYSHCSVYPPIGYITQEARVNKQAIFVDNLEHFLQDKPINVVT